MKKTILVLSLVLFFSNSYCQTTLSFCASINENGYCFLNNNQFISSPDSVSQRILMQVKDERTFAGTSKIVFKIYSVSKDKVETFETSNDQMVESSWAFAWTPYMFKSPGQYKVKIYNDRDVLLCEKGLQMFANK